MSVSLKCIKMPPVVLIALCLVALDPCSVTGVPVPFDLSSQGVREQSESPLASFPAVNLPLLTPSSTSQNTQQNSSGNTIVVEGSPQYNLLVQQQRNWSLGDNFPGGGGGGGQNSSNSTSLNGTTILDKGNQTCLLTSPTLCLHSLRDKQLRLMNIRDYVLNTLGYGKAPPTPVNKALVSAGEDLVKSSDTPFSGEIKRFHASCEVPVRVDKDVWTNPEFFHIYFKFISHPESSNGTIQNVSTNSNSRNVVENRTVERFQRGITTISAKLRLYKIGVGNNAESPKYEYPSSSEPCNDTENGNSGTQTLQTPTLLAPTISTESVAVDEKIRVSIYWYKAPVQKTHYKKKLLDTKMLSVKESKWVDFDVINAAIPWVDHQENNFGLVVQVENEDDDLLNPNKYFVNVPCTGNVSEGAQELSTPPMIEICTLNTPHTSREVQTEQQLQSFFPFPMTQSFNLLSRVAKAHATNAVNSRDTGSDWQNDDLQVDQEQSPLTTTTQAPQHKHRHRHGLKHKKNQHQQSQQQQSDNQNNGFKLDDDHPLRRILATVASNVNSRESRNHHKNSRHTSSSSRSDSEGDFSTESDRDIIIQKIYITSPNNRHSSSDNSDSNLNLDR